MTRCSRFQTDPIVVESALVAAKDIMENGIILGLGDSFQATVSISTRVHILVSHFINKHARPDDRGPFIALEQKVLLDYLCGVLDDDPLRLSSFSALYECVFTC